VAAGVFSQKEWDQLGEHGRAAIPRNRLFIQLGYILSSLSPAEGAAFFAQMPAPVRLLYRLIGSRQFAAEQKRLHPQGSGIR
jgi:hypothetical protein